MTRERKSARFTSIQVTPNRVAPHRALRRAVRKALWVRRGRFCAGVVAAGFAMTPLADAASFPPILPLASLLPGGGGDGGTGFVLADGNGSGESVSGAGDVNGDGVGDLIIGASDAVHSAGASYVVFGSSTGFPATVLLDDLYPPAGDGTSGFVIVGMNEDDSSGSSVSAAGDVNGDGVDDLIIGAPRDNSEDDVGESYVVFGSTEGFPAVLPLASLLPTGGGDGTLGFVLTGIDPDDGVGRWVSAAGDVNGDSVDDVVIGAWPSDPDAPEVGRTYVVFGSAAGFAPLLPLESLLPAGGGDGSAGFVVAGIDFGLSFGQGDPVSTAGDVNADGLSDLLIGARGASASYVVYGSTAGFPPIMPVQSLYPVDGGDGTRGFVLAGDSAGWAVSAAGDVNADGVDDLIVGAPTANPGGHDVGASYVVYGAAAGFPPVVPLAGLYPQHGGDGTRGFVITGIDNGRQSGDAVSGAGDVNADGVDDLILGQSSAGRQGDIWFGESWVVFGSAGGLGPTVSLRSLYPAGGGDGTAGFVLPGIDPSDYSGDSVSAAGDVNGDGIDDVIIGADGANPGGESYVVFGRSAVKKQRFR